MISSISVPVMFWDSFGSGMISSAFTSAPNALSIEISFLFTCFPVLPPKPQALTLRPTPPPDFFARSNFYRIFNEDRSTVAFHRVESDSGPLKFQKHFVQLRVALAAIGHAVLARKPFHRVKDFAPVGRLIVWIKIQCVAVCHLTLLSSPMKSIRKAIRRHQSGRCRRRIRCGTSQIRGEALSSLFRKYRAKRIPAGPRH